MDSGPGDVELTVIVISYNCAAHALACLQRLKDSAPSVRYEIIVLDNASVDASPDAIPRHFPDIHFIQSPTNLGFGGGVNLAARNARGRRLLLLNPDAFVQDGAIDQVWAFAEREPWRGIWGGRTFFADGRLNPASCWGKITLWSQFCASTGLSSLFRGSNWLNPEAYGGWQRDNERDVDVVTGCFLLIDTSLWQRLGGFDPLFFMYAEEADLCMRAALVGARPAITPSAGLVHLSGGATRSIDDEVVGLMRGRLTLMRKHWSPLAYRVGHLLTLASVGSRAVLAPLLTSSSAPRGKRPDWRLLWRRRSEWSQGYRQPVRS